MRYLARDCFNVVVKYEHSELYLRLPSEIRGTLPRMLRHCLLMLESGTFPEPQSYVVGGVKFTEHPFRMCALGKRRRIVMQLYLITGIILHMQCTDSRDDSSACAIVSHISKTAMAETLQ